MIRRLMLAAAIALAAPAGAALAASSPGAAQQALSPADQALVDKAAAYLDGIGEAQAHFVQTDQRGRTTEGELYLARPGKARFDYDKPASMLIVSDGSQVLLYDRRLKSVENYNLSATPLNLLLQKRVRLDGNVRIIGVDRFTGGFSITARDRRHEAQGQLTLTFSEDPMRLQGWTLVDAQGAHTSVVLKDLHPVRGLDPALFRLRDPRLPAPIR